MNAKRLFSILNQIPQGVAAYAKEGDNFIFVLYNQAGSDMDGVAIIDAIGKSVTEVFPGVADFGLLDVFYRVYETGQPEQHPVSLYQDDKLTAYRENYVFKLPTGEIAAVYTDETDKHMIETQYRQYAERKNALDTAQMQFVQNVSHELRTPIALISGYAEMLLTGELGELSDEIEKAVKVIARRSRFLTRFVKDILAILELEATGIVHQMETFDLSGLLSRLTSDYFSLAKKKDISFTVSIESGIVIRGDTAMIHQAVDNVTRNAIKFTPEHGRINFQLQHLDRNCVIRVTDTGIGIPQDALDLIFDRFYQVNGGTARKYEGTGLGLAVVKEVVDAHGGDVSVESELGKGSTFILTLPVVLDSAITELGEN